MSEHFTLELTARNLRMEIENYSREHPNDFGVPDGKERIPMKKLMKLFAIKKKTPVETQNLFRQLVNEHCELEMMDNIGKVLVLKECDGYDDDESSSSYGDNDDDAPDYGYGEGAPSGSDTFQDLKTESDDEINLNSTGRSGRFKPPTQSTSGGLSVATAESIGVYDPNNSVRRTGYRRRGSVTRYSIVGHDQVIDEYKKHEDVINQFRRDSLKIEHSIRNLNLGSGSNHSQQSHSEAYDNSPKKLAPSPAKKNGKALKGGSVKKLLNRTRFSLAF
jgi:hypothetical protein